jgi:hypothetical protein
MKSMLSVGVKSVAVAFFPAIVLVLAVLLPLCFAVEDSGSSLQVEKSKEATIYTIGPAKESEADKEEKERAWRMLENIRVDTRGEDGEGSNNNRRR